MASHEWRTFDAVDGVGLPLQLNGMKPETKPTPVKKFADVGKGMWIGLARKPEWRCLIAATGFAEAEERKAPRRERGSV